MNLRQSIIPKDKETKEIYEDLNGKIVCITGTIPGYTRFSLQTKLKQKFPKVLFTETVSLKTSLLILGHGVGQTKLNLAKKYNIPIIEYGKILS